MSLSIRNTTQNRRYNSVVEAETVVRMRIHITQLVYKVFAQLREPRWFSFSKTSARHSAYIVRP